MTKQDIDACLPIFKRLTKAQCDSLIPGIIAAHTRNPDF